MTSRSRGVPPDKSLAEPDAEGDTPRRGAHPPATLSSAEAVDELLSEALELLVAEKAALVRLDRTAIEAFAARKMSLDARLQRIPPELLGSAAVEKLRQIKDRAFDNRLLLTHARACAQGVLSLLAPEVAPGYGSGARPSKPPPVALDLKG